MEPRVGLELMTLRSRPELRSRVNMLNWLSLPDDPFTKHNLAGKYKINHRTL